MRGAITRKSGLPEREDDMYLDYAATTPLREDVKQYIVDILDDYGNPSSQYSLGDKTKKIIESARENVRKFINASEDARIVFTSSGSASNMLAVRGYIDRHYTDVYFSPLLHKSLYLYCTKNRKDIRFVRSMQEIEVEKYVGRINTESLRDVLSQKDKSESSFAPFVIIEYANSEVGTIQPVKEIVDIVHQYGGVVYVDCTGAISSIPIDVRDLGADMIGFSAHKLGALKGCGVLCIQSNNIELNPLIYGAQEYGLIGGTENVLGIASLGRAVEHYEYKTLSNKARSIAYGYIEAFGWKLIGDEWDRLPNNLYIYIPGINGADLVTQLDLHCDIQISNGSACNSGDEVPSSTLVAIRFPLVHMLSCIRITFSGTEDIDDISHIFCTIYREVHHELPNDLS